MKVLNNVLFRRDPCYNFIFFIFLDPSTVARPSCKSSGQCRLVFPTLFLAPVAQAPFFVSPFHILFWFSCFLFRLSFLVFVFLLKVLNATRNRLRQLKQEKCEKHAENKVENGGKFFGKKGGIGGENGQMGGGACNQSVWISKIQTEKSQPEGFESYA